MVVVADVIADATVAKTIPVRVRSNDGLSPSEAMCRRRPACVLSHALRDCLWLKA